jgi:hypothetical protein
LIYRRIFHQLHLSEDRFELNENGLMAFLEEVRTGAYLKLIVLQPMYAYLLLKADEEIGRLTKWKKAPGAEDIISRNRH